MNRWKMTTEDTMTTNIEYVKSDFVGFVLQMIEIEMMETQIKQLVNLLDGYFLRTEKRIKRKGDQLYMIKEKEPTEPQRSQQPLLVPATLPVVAQQLPLFEGPSEPTLTEEDEMTAEEKAQEKSRIGNQKKRGYKITKPAAKQVHCMKLVDYLGREYKDPIFFLREWFLLENHPFKASLLSFVTEAAQIIINNETDLKNKISREIVDLIRDHFQNISYDVRYCLGLTEDSFNNLRRMLHKDKNGKALLIGQEKMPTLYCSSTCSNKKKEARIEANVQPADHLNAFAKKESLFGFVNLAVEFVTDEDGNKFSGFVDMRQACDYSFYCLEKEGAFSVQEGNITIFLFLTGDATVKKKDGTSIMATKVNFVYDKNVFKDDKKIRKRVSQPFVIHASLRSESKLVTVQHAMHLGKQLAHLAHHNCCSNKNGKVLNVHYDPKYYSGDNSHLQKLQDNDSGKSAHRCPLCNACFHPQHVCKLLSFETTASLKEKSFANVSSFDSNPETYIRGSLLKKEVAKKRFTDYQIEWIAIQMQMEMPSNKLQGKTFTSLGRVDFIQKDLATIVSKFGGKWIKNKKLKADFTITTSEYLSQHNCNNQGLPPNCVSLRFLFAKIWEKEGEPVNINHFLLNGKEQTEYGCLHELDPMLDGMEGLSPLFVALKDELFKIDLLSAQSKLNHFANNCKIIIDNLHANKGSITSIWRNAGKLGMFDKAAFKKKNKNKTFSQFSCSKLEKMMCNYETIFIPHVKEDLKQKFREICHVWTEHQFLSKASRTIQQNPFFRIQMWGTSASLRILFKEVFGEKVAGLLNLYTHGSLDHFPIAFEVDALPIFSTSASEQEFSILNKQNTNHSPKNVLLTALDCTRNKWANTNITNRQRSGKKNVFQQWQKHHLWKKKQFPLDSEGKALLNLLVFHKYEKNKHYFIDSERNLLMLCDPPKPN